MLLIENYNTAMQKYGKKLTDTLIEAGVPPKFLLSACRFVEEHNLPIQEISDLFKDWLKYVVKYNNIDVNKISFEVFKNTIAQEKCKNFLNHRIYDDNNTFLFEIDSLKDARETPFSCCIKSRHKYIELIKKHKLFLILIKNAPSPLTYVIADVNNGEVDYWDMSNNKMSANHQYDSKHRHSFYEQMLPIQVKHYLYNIAAAQGEEIEKKQGGLNCNKIKNKIRLTEGQLHKIIKESVKILLRDGNLHGVY